MPARLRLEIPPPLRRPSRGTVRGDDGTVRATVGPTLRAAVVAAVVTSLVAPGCGLHLHRPRDAATAEGADGELKASRLVDGFVEELTQSQAMLTEEVAAAQAWAEVGRNRDLLDVLGARGEVEVEELYFKRCRARYKGDGWTTLCSKISTRLFDLVGHAFPLADPAPAAAPATKAKAPVAAPDPGADLLRDLRTLQNHWKGPNSGESQLGRAVNEHQMAARALRLGGADARAPGCPLFDPPGRAPVLQASIDRQRGLCQDRRDNLQALADKIVCHGPGCGASELGAVLGQAIAVHDALQQHNDELARRLRAYETAKQPCSGPEPPTKGRPKRESPPTRASAPSEPGVPTVRPEPAPATSAPAAPPAARPPSVVMAPAHARPGMSPSTGSVGHVPFTLSARTGPEEHVPFVLSAGAGLIGLPLALLAPAVRTDASTPSASVSPSPAPGAGVTAPAGTTAGTPTAAPGTVAPTPTPGTRLPGTPLVDPGTGLGFSPGGGACDESILEARFAALGDIPVPPLLVSHDLRPLAELGRRYQLAEQLAAVDALIEANQLRARRRDAADDDPAGAQAIAGAPRFARVLHTTIVGMKRLQEAVDTFELAVLALIRETLRVEHDALAGGIALSERRLRLGWAKLAGQLDEAVLLMEAHASLVKLERAGCTAAALMQGYEAPRCRDELSKSLVAFGNAWTLGRAAQKRADALDLGVRHDASILRSQAAMAMRQVYLAAGVTELVKFTKGGMAPEALAQLIVSTVGFGVLAGAVFAP